jgi:regulator of sigma D
MIEEIWKLLVSAEQNLIRYKDMGDEKAIRAGELMVADLQKMLEEI